MMLLLRIAGLATALALALLLLLSLVAHLLRTGHVSFGYVLGYILFFAVLPGFIVAAANVIGAVAAFLTERLVGPFACWLMPVVSFLVTRHLIDLDLASNILIPYSSWDGALVGAIVALMTAIQLWALYPPCRPSFRGM